MPSSNREQEDKQHESSNALHSDILSPHFISFMRNVLEFELLKTNQEQKSLKKGVHHKVETLCKGMMIGIFLSVLSFFSVMLSAQFFYD